MRYGLYCLLFLSCLLGSQGCVAAPKSKKTSYQYPFAVCAIFRDEARFLKEWIEFHKLVGATHFYLYNNLSCDDYAAVLAPYIAQGEVELEQWPFETTPTEGWTAIQTNAYQHAIHKACGKVKWLAILDLDEFLYPLQAPTMPAFLADFEGHGGVVVHWQLFGTSHVKRIPATRLLIETLVFKAHDGYCENGHVKSIVRPERVVSMTHPHIATYRAPYAAVNQNHHPIATAIAPIVVDKLRINHYWSRDEEFFYSFKIPRRQGWQEALEGQLQRLENINQIEDYAIGRFVPTLRQKMGWVD